MIKKGDCEKCHRKIQATLLDTCMFCGHALTGSQKFTEEEQYAVRVRRQHFKEVDDIKREGDEILNRWKGKESPIDLGDFFD